MSSLRATLSLFSYCRKFLQYFSSTVCPLHILLKNTCLWEKADKQETAYLDLQEQLRSAAVLKLSDPYKPLIMTTDSSQKGMGAVLSQLDVEGMEHLVWYASRPCNVA